MAFAHAERFTNDFTIGEIFMKSNRRSLLKLLLLVGFLFGFQTHLYAQQIRVVTTIPDLADITKQIGKELVNV